MERELESGPQPGVPGVTPKPLPPEQTDNTRPVLNGVENLGWKLAQIRALLHTD